MGVIRLVDTSVLVPVSLLSRPDVEAFSAITDLFLPQIAVGEFLVKIIDREDRASIRLHAWLDGVLEEAVVLSPGPATARAYARIHRHCLERGRPIPQNDRWIAATAAEHGLTVLTRDTHFEGLPGVDVELIA